MNPNDSKRIRRASLASLGLLLLSRAASGAPVQWTGAGGDLTWSTAGNWTPAAPATGDTVEFGVGASPTNPALNDTITVDVNPSLAQIHIGGSVPAFTLAGGTITLTGGTGILRDGTLTGTHRINNNLVLGANSTFSLAGGGGGLAVYGVISQTAGGAKNLTKSNGRPLELYGDNTFTGSVTNQNGNLIVGHPNALGLGTSNVLLNNTTNTVTADLHLANGVTLARSVVVRSNGNATAGSEIGGTLGSGSATFAGTVYLNRRVDVTGGNSGGVTTFAGPLVDAAADTQGVNGNPFQSSAVTKVNTATVRLAAANTYSGPTTVSAGTLLVNGSLSDVASGVSVLAGATLGGTGTIARDVSVEAGGRLAPGDGGVGTLAVTAGKTLSLADAAVLASELGATDAASDHVLASLAAFAGPSLTVRLSDAGAGAAPAATYTLLQWAGADPASLPALSLDPASGLAGDLAFVGGADGVDGGSIVVTNLTSVPEPASLGLIGAAGLLLLRRRGRA